MERKLQQLNVQKRGLMWNVQRKVRKSVKAAVDLKAVVNAAVSLFF
jgi:hypothetical protein